MLVTDLNYGDCYKFSQWELNKFPGLHRGIFMHQGDHSLYLGAKKGFTPEYVEWCGHEFCEVDVVSEEELYAISPDLLQ